MSRIYSGSFFHYTDSLKSLLSILKSGFKFSYSKEQFRNEKNELVYLKIPMVSFCDIPLGLIQHITYGGYALGMNRSWGNEKKLQPVNYYKNAVSEPSYKVMQKALSLYNSDNGKVKNCWPI